MGWERENIPGVKFDRPWKWVLVPGFVIQWIMYMFPEGGYASVRSLTRQSRSPLMTYVFSAIFYILVVAIIASSVHN